VHRGLVLGIPWHLRRQPAQGRLDRLVSLRGQVAGIVEGDVDVLNPARVEPAVELVPDKVA
jgi:hypothetical protein